MTNKKDIQAAVARCCPYAMAIAFLLLASLPFTASADVPQPVTVIYLYDTGCHKCTITAPLVRQAIEEAVSDGLPVEYREIPVSSPEGARYVSRYQLVGIPDLIVNNTTIMSPAYLEGDSDEVFRHIKATIASSYGYTSPLSVFTSAIRDGDNDVKVAVYVSNHGNTTINASLTGGLTNGSRLTAGRFFWSGPLSPGSEEKITYVLSGGNVSYISPSIVYYEDKQGSHIITSDPGLVSVVPALSLPVAFVAGILAAFNPCIIAVMAYMATLAVSDEKRHALLVNISAFTAGLLLMYSLVGICFYGISVIQPLFYDVARYVLIVSMVFIGSAMVLRTFFPGGYRLSDAGFKLFVSCLKPYNRIYTAAFCFAMGMGFGIIKMPCAGGPYLAILGLLADKSSSAQAVSYLFAYDLGVVLPVLGLGLLMAAGLSANRLEAIRIRYRGILNLSTGVVLYILAIATLFNIL